MCVLLLTAGCLEDSPLEGELAQEALFSPDVVTRQGTLRGVFEGGLRVFRGIPFAAPPVGPLRFALPAPVKPWTGVRSAAAYGPACPQLLESDAGVSTVGQEDCLYLNVWAPTTLPGEKLPVMFWVHGGAFVRGTASGYNPWVAVDDTPFDLYEGAELAERYRVVVVNVNYRLGPLGFLALPELTAKQGETGNMAMHDVLASLRWVKDNIAAFGGDPQNITAFGESAGAATVCSLVASPLASGLFQKAIIQSLYCIARGEAEAYAYGDAFVSRMGCDDAVDVLACLSGKTPAELIAPDPDAPFTLPNEGPYQPVYGRRFLPEPPLERIAARRHNAMPIILGGNTQEASFAALGPTAPTSFEELRAFFRALPVPTATREAFVSFYAFPRYLSARVAFAQAMSDVFMTCPQRQLARLFRRSQTQPVYRYVFDGPVPAFAGLLRFLGAFHGAELFYLFRNLDELPARWPSAAELALSDQMGGYWTRFARYGAPGGLPWWPASPQEQTMFLSTGLQVLTDYHAPPCNAFDLAVPPP